MTHKNDCLKKLRLANFPTRWFEKHGGRRGIDILPLSRRAATYCLVEHNVEIDSLPVDRITYLPLACNEEMWAYNYLLASERCRDPLSCEDGMQSSGSPRQRPWSSVSRRTPWNRRKNKKSSFSSDRNGTSNDHILLLPSRKHHHNYRSGLGKDNVSLNGTRCHAIRYSSQYTFTS